MKAYFAKNVAHLKRAAEKSPPQQPELAGKLIEIAESLEASGVAPRCAGNSGPGRFGAAADDSG